MASSNKTVTVLTPTGRRQNVTISSNSTILQILEEVCTKQGFKPEEYDLKHHNNVLDVTSIIRFSGLPNNAQLEMCPIQKIRAENQVILGLQLENGSRLTGEFNPNDNLWDILSKLCPNEINLKTNPVIIYMRQEIYGLESLKSTTLKSLGLTCGRAMLRLIHRKPEELHRQANVSTPLPVKPVEEKPYIRKFQKLDTNSEGAPDTKVTPNDTPKPNLNSRTPSPQRKDNNFLTNFITKEKGKKTTDISKIKSVKNIEVKDNLDDKNEEEIEDFAFLGERNALAFSLDMATTVPTELPDEFFDLTISDAKRLLRDLKQKRLALEESPLQTSALRNLEQNKKVLRQLNQYKKSVIRVQFPDRTVLQGTFKPTETVEIVKKFVTEFLEDPKINFHLYTTPPKIILDTELTLVDADCVPSSLLHFGNDVPVTDNYRYLKSSICDKFTSFSKAKLAAKKSRGKESNRIEPDELEEIEIDILGTAGISSPMDIDTDVNVGASTSREPEPPKVVPKENVPKWFKPSK